MEHPKVVLSEALPETTEANVNSTIVKKWNGTS